MHPKGDSSGTSCGSGLGLRAKLSSALAVAHLPSPEQAKVSAMPSYDGFRLNDGQRQHFGLLKGFARGSFGADIRVARKAGNGNRGERKQQQYDQVGGIADSKTPARLEQEGGENQPSCHGDKQAHQTTPKVSDRNDYEQEYGRGRRFYRASAE